METLIMVSFDIEVKYISYVHEQTPFLIYNELIFVLETPLDQIYTLNCITSRPCWVLWETRTTTCMHLFLTSMQPSRLRCIWRTTSPTSPWRCSTQATY